MVVLESEQVICYCCVAYHTVNQGCIEPLKAARGHATFIDDKMLSVTNTEFRLHKHVNRRRVPLMRSLLYL